MHPPILTIICARGGSKGCPGKNIRPFLGKPLIAHSIEQASAWGRADRIVVTTDSEAIADVAREYGADVPFIRPAELATDTACGLAVLTHALVETERCFNSSYDVIVELDPTSPNRSLTDLDQAIELLLATGADVVFSVVPARKNPYFDMIERKADGSVGLVKPLTHTFTGRQLAPKVFDMNGSICAYRRDFLIRSPGSLWEGRCELFEMPPESAFDINTETDFLVAEWLMGRRVQP